MATCRWVIWVAFASFIFSGCGDNSTPKVAPAPSANNPQASTKTQAAESDSSIASEHKSGAPEGHVARQPAIPPKVVSQPTAPGVEADPKHVSPVPVPAPTQVVDQPGPTATGEGRALDTAMIPSGAVGAFVAYPSRVVGGDQHLKALADQFEKEFPVPPADVEQLISIVGFAPPGPPHPETPTFETGMIVRLSKPHDAEKLAAQVMHMTKPEKFEIDGKTFYHAAANPSGRAAQGSECLGVIDERTFLVGAESDLRMMLAAKDVNSPLVKVLKKLDPTFDIAVVVVNRDDIRGAIAGLGGPDQPLPPSLAMLMQPPFKDLPQALEVAILGVKTQPDISLSLTLEGKDAAAAAKLSGIVAGIQSLGKGIVPAFRAQPRPDMPADQKASLEYGLDLLDKIIAGMTPRIEGNRVKVVVGGLGSIDDLVTKVLEPPIKAARTAAKGMMSANNLKQLALAMHNYNDSHSTFPPRAVFSKDGKPLLSWRIEVLPYVDEKVLYDQFHRDEPWDSEHNKPLIAQMPNVFQSPQGSSPAAEGRTRYVVATGKDTLFDGDKGISFSKVTDGLSNTLMILEVGADKSVIWTKPDEMEFDPKAPLAGLGMIPQEGLFAAFADGSVQRLHKTIDPETFRRLILCNDGQPIDPSKF